MCPLRVKKLTDELERSENVVFYSKYKMLIFCSRVRYLAFLFIYDQWTVSVSVFNERSGHITCTASRFLGVACLYRSWRGGTMRSRRHLWRKAATAPAQAAKISTTTPNSTGCIRKLTNCTVPPPGEYRQQHYNMALLTYRSLRVRDGVTTICHTRDVLLLVMIPMLLIAHLQVCPITWA